MYSLSRHNHKGSASRTRVTITHLLALGSVRAEQQAVHGVVATVYPLGFWQPLHNKREERGLVRHAQ
jgi:hypothetical protein